MCRCVLTHNALKLIIILDILKIYSLSKKITLVSKLNNVLWYYLLFSELWHIRGSGGWSTLLISRTYEREVWQTCWCFQVNYLYIHNIDIPIQHTCSTIFQDFLEILRGCFTILEKCFLVTGSDFEPWTNNVTLL